mmetsp:Transcript_9069/g.24373  ORF Transcript_9069/g.24373 Transcript_9069/m.24373 type:complete len:331 (-) Transcript_9069:1503-2495(-)
MCHRLLHHARGLDDLRQEHLASAEQVAHHIHAIHEGALDDLQRLLVLAARARLLRVLHRKLVDALDEPISQALAHKHVAPGLLFFAFATAARDLCCTLLLHSCGVALGLQRSGVLHHALSGVVTPVQQHILNELQQLLVNLLIHILLHLCGVHDAHVHARLACVVQEGRVEATAHSLVAAEAEGDVGHAPADLGARAHALDLPRGADKVHGIVVVLSHAGADGQDIGVKDDILWVEAHFLHQQLVGTLANADLLCAGGGLAFLIERHDHHSSPMALDGAGLLQEWLHALLQADAVHNALALAALQACLHNGKLGAVDHEGHLADLGVCDQ